ETAASDGDQNRAEVYSIPIHRLRSPSPPPPIPDKLRIAISESRRPLPKSTGHPENAGSYAQARSGAYNICSRFGVRRHCDCAGADDAQGGSANKLKDRMAPRGKVA